MSSKRAENVAFWIWFAFALGGLAVLFWLTQGK
jgi:hypothetical protein